jgi:phosphohistidine swiveling domain-containing protein
MATLRNEFSGIYSENQLLAFLDASLTLEDDLFRSSNDLLISLNQTSLKQRLAWLKETTSALYGMGILSSRQWQALQENINGLMQSQPLLLNDYRAGLDYAARVPGWSDRAIRFHFAETVKLFSLLESIAGRYVHDRLRGSLLLFYAAVLDSMLADANLKSGIQTNLFGQQRISGLTGLNAGLSRGILHVVRNGDAAAKFERNGIYVLPATTEDLPPVAGIITAGKGNILSHVQLLARNLGIPNVAVDKKLLPQISSHAGQKVVLAVSPEGIVQLVEDGPQWDDIFSDENKSRQALIRPDLAKLDLYNHSFIPLQNIRAGDSGRIAGPKAANLGELKHYFPQAVTDGLVIPFGIFRSFLDRPLEPDGPSVFHWMQSQYALIRSLQSDARQQEAATRRFLTRIRDWIVHADAGPEFRERLRGAMENVFGPDGTYGVFVRSDTNVEDLPGFTGAGLNLTVANVVGFENVLTAIQRVWASPFTERAYQWRQAYMDHPENVYASVLLLKSVPAEKSGVMVTVDVTSGKSGWLTIAVNEGVGGAVSGQTSEELRVHTASGRVRLMAQATEPRKRILLKTGGMAKISAGGSETVLSANDIELLLKFAESVPQRFPKLLGADGQPVPADIEFGFYRNQLVLFQIRPFLDSVRARQNLFLNHLDQALKKNHDRTVNLETIPGE